MKILVLTQFYFPEHFSITPLCEELIRLGHEVTVVTSQPTYGFDEPIKVRRPSMETLQGVKVYRVNAKPRGKTAWSIIQNYLSFYLQSKRFVKNIRGPFDIVFSMSFSPIISVSAGIDYAKKHHLPHLLYAVDIWPETAIASGHIKRSSMLHRLLQTWSKSIYHAMDFILVGSPGYASYLVSEHQIKKERLATLIQPSMVEPLSIQKNFQQPTALVYAGNLGKLQPLDSVIHALKEPSFASLTLTILGQGTEIKKLEHLVNQLQLTQRVRFLGYGSPSLNDQILKEADAFVISLQAPGYLGSTIPSKAVHYLAYQKPIIGLLGLEGSQWLNSIQGKELIGTTPKDIPSLLHKLIAMNEKDYRIIQEKIARFYQEQLTLKMTTKKLEHYLRELIKGNKR